MSLNIIKKIETEDKENELLLKNNIVELNTKASISINMKVSALN